MADEQLLDVYSRTDVEGGHRLATCTLVIGDGTLKVPFVNGRAQVTREHAKLIADHPDLHIPAMHGASADGDEVEQLRARVAELEANQPADVPADPPPPAADTPADPPAGVTDVSEAIKAAIEHLEEEGEDVPPPAEVVVDPNFDPLTADNQPRCQARKGDGAQCSNAATTGSACQIGKHQEQLTAV